MFQFLFVIMFFSNSGSNLNMLSNLTLFWVSIGFWDMDLILSDMDVGIRGASSGLSIFSEMALMLF